MLVYILRLLLLLLLLVVVVVVVVVVVPAAADVGVAKSGNWLLVYLYKNTSISW